MDQLQDRFLHMVVQRAHHQRYDPSLKTELVLLATAIRVHTITLIHLRLLELQVGPPLQHPRWLLPRPLLGTVMTGLLRHLLISDTASGKTANMPTLSHPPTTKSARNLKSLTAVALRLLTQYPHPRWLVTVRKQPLMLVVSTTVTIHLRPLTMHLHYLLWQPPRLLHRAYQKHQNKNAQSIMNQLLVTWMLMRTTMTKVRTPNRVRPSQSAVLHGTPQPMEWLMLLLQLSRSRRRTLLTGTISANMLLNVVLRPESLLVNKKLEFVHPYWSTVIPMTRTLSYCLISKLRNLFPCICNFLHYLTSSFSAAILMHTFDYQDLQWFTRCLAFPCT